VNIVITTAIIVSTTLITSLFVFILSIFALLLFYGTSKLKDYVLLLNKFKALFIMLIIIQLLLRRQGEIYFEFFVFRVTDIGVFFAFNSILLYFVILLSATMFASASPYKMIKALRTWCIPEAINTVVSFTILFLRQLKLDLQILKNNLIKRNISLKHGRLGFKINLISSLIIPILGTLFSDIKYKVIAMELNGYGENKFPKPYFYTKCRLLDYLTIFLFLTITYFILF
jgi:energy-coupling factor transporter transmembrane protein EcfT